MNISDIRRELYAFYLQGDADRARAFSDKCFKIMNERATYGMSVLAEKLMQYDVITEEFEPVIFRTLPYFYETGVLTSLCDGSLYAKGHGFVQANGWVYTKNEHIFKDQDPELYELMSVQKAEKLYLICGPYNDVEQHFNFNCRPFLEIGARGIYERAEAELSLAECDDEREFLRAVCHGMLTLKKMAEKFALKAEEILKNEASAEHERNLSLIASAAHRVPWERPRTLHEALSALAFLRVAMGSLEGAGPNTFGRLDKDLIDFYRRDIAEGRLTEDEAYDLVLQFLLIWDCHYDHDMIMRGYADHELENTYTLGGCDDDGNPIYNELTRIFLRATRDENIIFPKIKCRYSASSPDEYLADISRAIADGTSTVLLQNDDATIPALTRAGKTLAEARDYAMSGCWDPVTSQEKYDHGSYLNLLKPLEYSIHNLEDKMERVGIRFETLDGSGSFDELYSRVLSNCERLLDAKLDVKRRGGQVFHKVSQFPIFSSTLDDCIKNRRDFTRGGARYNDDYQLVFGLPNIVDSLMAIKTLVFDKKRYTLNEYLDAVRKNWDGNEKMRVEATRCHGWGDGHDDSTAMASRFNGDLYEIFAKKVGTYGGRVHMGHLTYTEIRWWGEQTLATPDGRRSGEYFAQGLTPSRLKSIPCVTDVINSLNALDPSMIGANSVVNIILPPRIPTDRCIAFLRAAAGSAMQSLQLNCTSREELLDAREHPEKYPNLIVRVTGFSAKFTSLSPEWQDEVISRNFYE